MSRLYVRLLRLEYLSSIRQGNDMEETAGQCNQQSLQGFSDVQKHVWRNVGTEIEDCMDTGYTLRLCDS
jgi:hypothetical protein